MNLDLICVGRCMVDLYCDQVGSPLEHGQSLSMYVGGCPTNVAVGAARLGLRTAMLTRVGEDGTGRFVVETLRREGIDVSRVRTAPGCLTPVVVVGIEPPGRFPIDWYRERPSDLALDESDLDRDFLASARAVLVSGNSMSRPDSARVLHALVSLAPRVVYDLDYRPALWQGDPRPWLQSLLPQVALVVGTEEEYEAAGGFDLVRSQTPGTCVRKLGPAGAEIAPPGEEPFPVPGFPVPVLNTLGAGDAFLAGFLSGWLRDQPLEECARRGNANGALVVSRHGCAPAMPFREEVERFLADPRLDPELERLHARLSRGPLPEDLLVSDDVTALAAAEAAGRAVAWPLDPAREDPALALRSRPRTRAVFVRRPLVPVLLRLVQQACDAWGRHLVVECDGHPPALPDVHPDLWVRREGDSWVEC